MEYTRYTCFLCLWNSRADEQHYNAVEWPAYAKLLNVYHVPLVDAKKVFLPLLYIKLGLIKIFVKAMNQDGDGFKHIRKPFPKKLKAKLKQGIFVKFVVRKLQRDKIFKIKLTSSNLAAWEAVVLVIENFQGKHKATNYEKIVGKMLQAYKKLSA